MGNLDRRRIAQQSRTAKFQSDDPWTVIDAEIEELGLDNEDLGPHTKCNDQLIVYGAQDVNQP